MNIFARFFARVAAVFVLLATFSLAAININTASEAELATLKGIGPVKAKAIVEYRTATPFKSIEDLKNVKGIGPKIFDAIKDQIVTEDLPADAAAAPAAATPADAAKPAADAKAEEKK